MKKIKFLLVAILFVAGISANAQFTDNGTYSTTNDSIRIGYAASPYPSKSLMLSVKGSTYIDGNLFCNKILKALSTTSRFDFGFGAVQGANVEFYSTTHATLPGQMKFIYGGPGVGSITFAHWEGGSVWSNKMVINNTGNVGIGTDTPTSKLTVVGDIASTGALKVNGKITTKEVEVTLTGWPDYVFNEDYKLTPLSDVEKYININKHLPGIKSAKEIEENGLSLGEMNKQLMSKVEELTLYVIQLQKEVNTLKSQK
jgi:hypothetical protein